MRGIFQYLAIANLIDGALTFIGLQLSLIQEANPLMSFLYDIHPLLFISVKVFLTCILYFIILIDRIPKISLLKGLTVIASLGYTVVLLLHGTWIADVMI